MASCKSKGGEFVLRIEDTDIERSTEEAKQAILDGMLWLGLTWDTGPIYQTERFDRYKELIQKLLDEGKAYKCFMSSEELDAIREAQKSVEKNRVTLGHGEIEQITQKVSLSLFASKTR